MFVGSVGLRAPGPEGGWFPHFFLVYILYTTTIKGKEGTRVTSVSGDDSIGKTKGNKKGPEYWGYFDSFGFNFPRTMAFY